MSTFEANVSFRFPMSDCFGAVSAYLDPMETSMYVQAQLQLFGIEFLYESTYDPGTALPEEVRQDVLRVLHGILPWTPGPPRPDGVRLTGRIQGMTLRVDTYPVEDDPRMEKSVLQLQTEHDFYPERYRRAFGLP